MTYDLTFNVTEQLDNLVPGNQPRSDVRGLPLEISMTYEPVRERTNNFGFRPGLIQTELYKHRRWLEALNFGFKKKKDCTNRVAKTRALICFAVTAKLICVFVFAYADCWFSHAAAHICSLWSNVFISDKFPTSLSC